jgi:two-component system chemotaxis response regulator CheB
MPSGDIVAIGSSTGGVEALLSILTLFPETCPPTVITQHMPATFTASFAARLDRASGAKVQEATTAPCWSPARSMSPPAAPRTWRSFARPACVAAWSRATRSAATARRWTCCSTRWPAVGDKAVGAILTGMGRDGAQGLLAMRKAGAKTLGQDEAECVVYGMPRSAFELGAVEKQVSLSSMGQSILDLASARR